MRKSSILSNMKIKFIYSYSAKFHSRNGSSTTYVAV